MLEILVEYLAQGFMIMLTISMPCVLVAAGIGLVVGILQAVTQVQEQTIAAAPKILGVFLVIVIGGFGFIRLLTFLPMVWRWRSMLFLKTTIMFLLLITIDILQLSEKLHHKNSEIRTTLIIL